jgi:hypothetical protein
MMLLKQPRNDKMVIVIENPRGKLQDSPLMYRCCENEGLQIRTVAYCNFGRLEQKMTHLWTNHVALLGILPQYAKCSCSGAHRHRVRDDKHLNFAAIPEFLARLVATTVDALRNGSCGRAMDDTTTCRGCARGQDNFQTLHLDHGAPRARMDILRRLAEKFATQHSQLKLTVNAIASAMYSLGSSQETSLIDVIEVCNQDAMNLTSFAAVSWVHEGMTVRRLDGSQCGMLDLAGTVSRSMRMIQREFENGNKRQVPEWEVTFTDGTVEHVTANELMKLIPRNLLTNVRKLHFLDLFGTGSNHDNSMCHEFIRRGWKPSSVDMKSYLEYMGVQREDVWQKRLLLYLQTPPDVVFCSAAMSGAVASRVQDLLRTIQVGVVS